MLCHWAGDPDPGRCTGPLLTARSAADCSRDVLRSGNLMSRSTRPLGDTKGVHEQPVTAAEDTADPNLLEESSYPAPPTIQSPSMPALCLYPANMGEAIR